MTEGYSIREATIADAETIIRHRREMFFDMGHNDDAVLDELTEEALAEVLMAQLPANMQNIFCAIVIGPGAPLRKLDVLECFVYQHGLRHMGEIEHGRALVGLSGMTS